MKDSYETFKYVPREREITSDFFAAPRSKQNTSINHAARLSSPAIETCRYERSSCVTRINFFIPQLKTINNTLFNV